MRVPKARLQTRLTVADPASQPTNGHPITVSDVSHVDERAKATLLLAKLRTPVPAASSLLAVTAAPANFLTWSVRSAQ